ncbi:hypothetical protein C2W63_01252 [Bacillus velezensis]|nr:hypothetical protein HS9_02771 [Bacillus velezensis]RAP12570.1 hypothetical protein C2W63_01252 [Bacillus velezensis]
MFSTFMSRYLFESILDFYCVFLPVWHTEVELDARLLYDSKADGQAV